MHPCRCPWVLWLVHAVTLHASWCVNSIWGRSCRQDTMDAMHCHFFTEFWMISMGESTRLGLFGLVSQYVNGLWMPGWCPLGSFGWQPYGQIFQISHWWTIRGKLGLCFCCKFRFVSLGQNSKGYTMAVFSMMKHATSVYIYSLTIAWRFVLHWASFEYSIPPCT